MPRMKPTGVRAANVVSVLALFVALGGTSYAAVELSRNSVGARALKSDSVGSSELKRGAVSSGNIRNRAIEPSDLSSATKRALAGKPGPAGPAGASAATLRVSIASSGELVAGAYHSLGGEGPNKRLVGFGRPLAGCVPTATLARLPGGFNPDPGPGSIVVASEGDLVAVETTSADGTRQYLPFNLIVAC